MTAPQIVVVGAGYFAAFHVQGWIDAGARVAGIVDTDVSRARALAARFGLSGATDELDPLLGMRPTLVDVALPPHAQAGVVRRALAAGLPVVCQKPFGVDYDDARAMAADATAAGIALVVHENFRFMPWFRECRRLIDGGTLGRVHGISMRLRPGDGQGPQAYLARQPYFRTMSRFLVRETGVHFIDVFRYLCGPVRAVTARLRRLNPHIAGEDAGIVIFEFADGSTGLFDGNRLNDHSATDPRRTLGEMWLEAEAGVLRLDGDARLWFKPHGEPERPHPYDPGPPDRVFGGAVSALQAHVLAHLRHGAPLHNRADRYLANLRVQAAIYDSHETGQRVVLADTHTDTHDEGDTP